jgi:hypothetical protein
MVSVDDGNASSPLDVALVRADTADKAKRLACVAYSDDQMTQDDFHKVTAEKYEGGLDLREGHDLEWLN